MNFDKESKSDHFLRRGVGEGDTDTKTVCQTVSVEVKYKKMHLSTQCRTCGTINISKYVHNFLSTNATTLILSSLVNDF